MRYDPIDLLYIIADPTVVLAAPLRTVEIAGFEVLGSFIFADMMRSRRGIG